jgi:protease-4
MQFSNFEELLKKIGIKGMVLKSGEHKDIGSPFREMTSEEKAIMQEVLNNVHQQFIQAVADGRKLDRSKVIQVADGRILTGEQAKNLGLVDQMGNLQDTIDIAAKMVGIVGKPNVIYPKRKISIWELLMRDMASAIIDVLNEKGYELNFPLQIK